MSKGSEIRIIKKLGEGSFSEVFMAKSSSTGETFAIKRLKKRYRSIDEVQHLPEIYALQVLQGHPNIIDLLNLSYDSNNGYVSMFFELMDYNVYELITEHKKPFDEQTTLILIYQLLKAISFIHSKNLFHRDIKPENCMVNKNTMELKLCDFGSTRSATNLQPYTEYVSTRWYRAPECILTSGSYGVKVDEWAVGCMIYEIMTTRPLFPGKNEIDQIGRIHNLIGTPSRELLETFKLNPNTQIKFSFPQRQHQDLKRLLPNASNDIIYLIESLLTYDPEYRISAREALDLPVFEEIQRCEEEWQATDQTIPFPLFYLRRRKSNIQNTINQEQVLQHKLKSEEDSNIYKTKAEQQQKYLQQQYYKQQQQQQYYHSPGAIVTHHQFPINDQQHSIPYGYYQTTKPKQATNFGGIPQAGQTLPAANKQPKKDISLIESRIKAAQRIAEYKKKQMMFSKKPQPFITNQFPGSKIKGNYQHPRVELVHPRLPKIII